MDSKRQFWIFHFNDVYEIEESKEEPVGGAARFVTACKQFREQRGEDGLILFSGDLFSPSTLSVLYKGEQMLDPINACDVDVACVGNHEFDFGLEQVESLFQRCNFPWLCSNIFNIEKANILANNKAYFVCESGKVKIGIMGLGEEEWLNAISEIDVSIIRYEDFVECAKQLVLLLRDELECEIIIALTHMRVPNDRKLAHDVPGIDLILGGHDHIVLSEQIGECLYVKSGSDFKDYSILEVTLSDFTCTGGILNKEKGDDLLSSDGKQNFSLSNRLKVNLTVGHITKDIKEDEEIQVHVNGYIEKSLVEMAKVIGYTEIAMDSRFSTIRTSETNFGNLYADVVRREVQADVSILNSGTIRSDCIFAAGEITYSMMNKALPFADIIVVQQLTGQDIHSALENGVCKYPSFDGRFPLISGMAFAFDPAKPPGERVPIQSVRIGSDTLDPQKKYSVATKQYISIGKDGYDMFINKPYILDYENGLPHLQIMISFFKSLDSQQKQVFPRKSDFNQPFQLIQHSVSLMDIPYISKFESQSSSEEIYKNLSPRLLKRQSSGQVFDRSPSIQNLPNMLQLKNKLSRREKADKSGIIVGIKILENQSYIIIAPKIDGRIQIIK